MDNFGGIMKVQMARLQIKQEMLAKELNIARTTVSAYCNNKRQPDIETLAKICKYLQINLSKILDIPDFQTDYYIHNDFEWKVNQICRKVDVRYQTKFLQAVEFLGILMQKEELTKDEILEELNAKTFIKG